MRQPIDTMITAVPANVHPESRVAFPMVAQVGLSSVELQNTMK